MANRRTAGTKLTGLNPLAYIGVEPSSPPQLVRYERQPNERDFGFNIGDIWMVDDPTEVWMLADKPQNVADWILIYPQAGGSGGITIVVTPTGDVIANLDSEINFNDGENTNCTRVDANTLNVNLNRTIFWPDTNVAGTEGLIYFNGETFLHNYSTTGGAGGNTYLGVRAGGIVGDDPFSCTGIGFQALQNISTGENNTALGFNALRNITTGTDSIGIGYRAGFGINGAGNFNIMIGNEGLIGDSGITRIGAVGFQTQTHISGIYATPVLGTPTPKSVVNVDDQGQLGEVEFTSLDNSVTITQTDSSHIDFSFNQSDFSDFSMPFFGLQRINAAAVAAPGYYSLGAGAALTPTFDYSGGAFYPGDGAGTAASFTAPVDGVYIFRIAAINTGASASNYIMRINIPGGPYYYSYASTVFYENNVSFQMTAGQVMTVDIRTVSSINTTIAASYLIPSDPTKTADQLTYIYGQRVA